MTNPFHLHLRQALSEQRCHEIVATACRHGFAAAPVAAYGRVQHAPSVRNNDRAQWTDAALAAEIEAALRAAAGTSFPEHFNQRRYALVGDRLRAYRYRPGQFFRPHRDGEVTLEAPLACRSAITCLVYLNDAAGGETVLMPGGYADQQRWVTVAPRTGDILLFEHGIWHEGKSVHDGEKLVLRTDLFYLAG